MISGYRPGVPERRKDVTVCARCGAHRTAGTNSSVLCRDCTACLTVAERELWKPAA